MLLFFLPHLVRISSTGASFSESVQNRLMLSNLVLVGFFYFNAYFLYPVILKKRGILVYGAVLIALVFVFINSISLIERSFFPIKPSRESVLTTGINSKNSGEGQRTVVRRYRGSYFYFSVLPYVFIIGISISYRIVGDASRQEKIRKERENEALKSELTFLRSQVSPHFMFNVLNTLVSMARKKSDMMEPSLIKLSSLMRYMLYESNEEKILLEQEVEYIKSYIDLQLLRFGDDINIKINFAKDIGGYQIEPMLLISFVENAFKHGVGVQDEPFINMDLKIDRSNHSLMFIVENSVAPSDSAKDRSSGIGLNNMKRRLELMYKNRYALETFQDQSKFVSKLIIQLT